MVAKVIAVALGLTVAPVVKAAPLHLVCIGNGSANRITSTYGSAWASNGASAWGQAIGTRDVPFDDQVNIDLEDDGTGRIRMPRAMLPPVRGGKDGWFEIKNVERGENEITGTVQVNIFNSPKMRIDRIRGHISLSGKAGDYAGKQSAPRHRSKRLEESDQASWKFAKPLEVANVVSQVKSLARLRPGDVGR